MLPGLGKKPKGFQGGYYTVGVDLRVKNSHSQMITISRLFWKIKCTWAKFLKAVLFGDNSNFTK